VTLAEASFALGDRQQATAALERLVAQNDVPPEDAARALDRLGEIYDGLHDLDGVARVSELIQRHFVSESHYARRSASAGSRPPAVARASPLWPRSRT